MTLLADTARQILLEAATSEFGIQILIEDLPENPIVAKTLRAKQILYRFKQEDTDFANLQIRLAPNDPDNRLWITKG